MPYGFKKFVHPGSAPSHDLNHYWHVIRTLPSSPKNIFQWNFIQNLNIFIQENSFENVVSKMSSSSLLRTWLLTHYFQPHRMGHGQHLNLKWTWMDGLSLEKKIENEIYGSVQNCGDSIANALELLQFCWKIDWVFRTLADAFLFPLGLLMADSRLAPSQWETSLQSNGVSHWLGANLEWALPLHCILYEIPLLGSITARLPGSRLFTVCVYFAYCVCLFCACCYTEICLCLLSVCMW